jgi:2-amino-4-hydroxy-6-hydroxymethyldihydropteridine diphosphokinase
MTIDAVVGLGSNQGDPEKRVLEAAATLEHVPGIVLVGLSSGYWTEPVGPPQPPFLNGALRLKTTLSPPELMATLLGVEAALGRRRKQRFGPRLIDLDLLFAGPTTHNSPLLALPHPRLHERPFALIPLVEVWPEATDPVTGRAYARVLADLDCQGVGKPHPLPHAAPKDLDGARDNRSFSLSAPTRAALFETVTQTWVNLVVDRQAITERERRVLRSEGSDSQRLESLVGELKRLITSSSFLPRRVCLLNDQEKESTLALYGEPFQAGRQLRTVLTNEQLRVEVTSGVEGWSAAVQQ